MRLSPIPAHRLLCSIVTDDHGNEMQLLPPLVSWETYQQGSDFWFDGFSDPDLWADHEARVSQ